MYTIKTTNKFNRDLRKAVKRGLSREDIGKVLSILEREGKLPAQYRPHKLTGDYKGCWECHIKADWLLVWQQNDTELILLLTDTGTHSDLFG